MYGHFALPTNKIVGHAQRHPAEELHNIIIEYCIAMAEGKRIQGVLVTGIIHKTN